MVKKMAPKPIIFAMANPDPEIRPEDVHEVRPDAIVATGRSDYPNQINNVLGFPYIFRGALDVRASTINDAMKIAAAEALAKLARFDVPDEVAAAYGGQRPRYGNDYIIPAPFDPRLISSIPTAVARAAVDSGVARRKMTDFSEYAGRLSARLSPAAGWLQAIFEKVRRNPKRVVFAEGEEEQVVRAANGFHGYGLGQPILIGRPDRIQDAFADTGIEDRDHFEIVSARDTKLSEEFAEFLYRRLQRRGLLFRDVKRLVNNDRNVFGACMVALGHADAMVTGVTRNWSSAYEDIRQVLDPKLKHTVIGVSLVLSRGRAVLVADTSVHDMPTAEQLARIAVEAASVSRRLGNEPRVAMLAYSTFGHPKGERSERIREAVQLLNDHQVDFEYDGDMGADVALNREKMRLYPFCRLTDTANVLVMPAFHSASISTKMLQELGGSTVIGPLLVGLTHPVQIVSLGAKDSDIVNMAALAAYDING
jgi:malate dehydrogenase (oxaloacetate-decarboxylating)(NADP+)